MDFISYAFVLFTVAAYSQCDISITQSPGTTIPDDASNGNYGIQHDITVPAQPGCFVDSLSIALEVTHPNVGELQFSLNDFDFFSEQCYGTSDLLVTVTDSSDIPYGCPKGADDVQPSSPFAGEFGGDLLDVETIWTLSVIDTLESDEGTLESWALCITTYCPTTTTMPMSTTTAMPISTATAMPISTTATTTTTMAISSDSSSDSSSESAESDDSSDDANNALFAGNEEMDNNNNELPEYGTYSLSFRFSDFSLVNIWLLICVICVNVIVCCFYHKKKTNCY